MELAELAASRACLLRSRLAFRICEKVETACGNSCDYPCDDVAGQARFRAGIPVQLYGHAVHNHHRQHRWRRHDSQMAACQANGLNC